MGVGFKWAIDMKSWYDGKNIKILANYITLGNIQERRRVDLNSKLYISDNIQISKQSQNIIIVKCQKAPKILSV